MKIIEHRGACDLVAAIITEDTTETYSTGEYFPLAGLQSVAKTTESESATKYYDNVPAIIIESVGADTVTLIISVPDLATYAKVLGMSFDESTGVLIEGGETKAPYLAIGYKTGLVGAKAGQRYVSRLKGKFSIPEEEVKTADNGTDSSNMQLVYTGINTTHRFSKTGNSAKAVVVDNFGDPDEKIDFDKYFTKVTTPDNIPVKQEVE